MGRHPTVKIFGFEVDNKVDRDLSSAPVVFDPAGGSRWCFDFTGVDRSAMVAITTVAMIGRSRLLAMELQF